MKRGLLVPVLAMLAVCASAAIFPCAADSPLPPDPPFSMKSIRVVMDDNYPPFAFRDAKGTLQGILVDQWKLWEKKTGIRAEVRAMDWGEAQRRMQAGEFDVIDTIFRNAPRERIYEFSKPYARLDVPIFFHNDITGITDASSLKGFPVAVKNGDAAVHYLLERGVTRLIGYDSYEEILLAARDRKVAVFVVDKPPALYYLHKLGIRDAFQMSRPMYAGEFHRAVRKGDKALLAAVEDGFARISPKERQEIDREWFGTAAWPRISLWHVGLALLAGLVPILGLAAWNRILRKSVERKTAELKEETRRASEQAERLRVSEENYRTVVENAGDGIVILREGRVLFSNHGGTRILGIPHEEVRGRSFLEFVHPEDRELVGTNHARRMRGEEAPARYEFRVLTPSGETLWVQVHAVLTAFEGKPVSLAFLRDITRQKRLEEQLVQSRKMEAIGRLAGGIAHDFNNLLSVIIGYSHLLLNTRNNGAPHAKELKEIRKAADRAADLTRQLLAFSRKQLLQPKVVSLNDIITGMTPGLRRLIREDIELSASLQRDLPPVRVDPAQVEQVILNLAVNARDAMPMGGKLVIGTKSVLLPESVVEENPSLRPGSYVELFVSDTGMGMEKGIIPKIFEPFFTTKELGKGTGLGLSTVEGIVGQSQGHVSVESEPGRGTTFRILLPEVERAVPADAEKPAEEGAWERKTVLVVEDDPGVRNLVRTVLESGGYGVILAGDGVEAVRVSREHRGPVHLLVSDVVMPGMSGRALADEIRRDRHGIKVLFMSGYDSGIVGGDGLLGNGDEFIGKPFSPFEFAKRVRRILSP